MLKRKPQFGLDLVHLLIASKAPIFVEFVDKAFYICANIVTSLIATDTGKNYYSQLNIARRSALATFLHACLPASLVHGYAALCDSPSKGAVIALLLDLRGWVEDLPPSNLTIDLMLAIELNLSTARLLGSGDDLAKYLPPPSRSKTGGALWMLPHSSSLTNIYARINKFHGGRVAHLTLVHDEQVQLDSVLHQMKAETEAIRANASLPRLAHADYRFSQFSSLRFASSDSSIGIQAADVIAGLVARQVRSSLSKAPRDDSLLSALHELAGLPAPLGINFVVSDLDYARIVQS